MRFTVKIIALIFQTNKGKVLIKAKKLNGNMGEFSRTSPKKKKNLKVHQHDLFVEFVLHLFVLNSSSLLGTFDVFFFYKKNLKRPSLDASRV